MISMNLRFVVEMVLRIFIIHNIQHVTKDEACNAKIQIKNI